MPSKSSDRPEKQPGNTRLDRELEEILQASERERPLPRPPKIKAEPVVQRASMKEVFDRIPPPVRRYLGVPIFQAVGLGILAVIVDSFSPLLAAILCIAAVVCIMIPVIQRFRTPPQAPGAKMWRGRVVDFSPPPVTTSPWETIRRWLSGRR